jgi:hypothetical protein
VPLLRGLAHDGCGVYWPEVHGFQPPAVATSCVAAKDPCWWVELESAAGSQKALSLTCLWNWQSDLGAPLQGSRLDASKASCRLQRRQGHLLHGAAGCMHGAGAN